MANTYRDKMLKAITNEIRNTPFGRYLAAAMDDGRPDGEMFHELASLAFDGVLKQLNTDGMVIAAVSTDAYEWKGWR